LPNGIPPKTFPQQNASKALYHVVKVPGYDMWPCRGSIPSGKSRQYRDFYFTKTLTREQKIQEKQTMTSQIDNLQERTVQGLGDGPTPGRAIV
jgi:hypothetical protein